MSRCVVLLSCLIFLVVGLERNENMEVQYNSESQVWAMSFLPGLVDQQTAPTYLELVLETQNAMEMMLDSPAIQNLIGEWNLVWGPGIYSKKSNATKVKSDNCAMIVKEQNSERYVLGIAGTNPYSTVDWLEDARVATQVSWHRTVPGAPRSSGSIARGTNNGLSEIMALKDTHTNQTIIEFLHNTTFSDATLYVAGHSLGGALTSVVGLYLIEMEDMWKSATDSINLKFRPSAGPTPGNEDWNSYFFDKIAYEEDNDRFVSQVNTVDIVPQAWDPATMVDIPTFYESCIPPTLTIKKLVDVAMSVGRGKYTQMPNQTYFTTDFEELPGHKCNATISAKNTAYFFAEVGYQHMNGYYDHLGICEFMQQFNCTQLATYPTATGGGPPVICNSQPLKC